MIRVEHLAGSPFAGGYRSDQVRDVWPVGELRRVPNEVGDYLVSTFPMAFVEVRGGKRVAREPSPVDPSEPEVPPALRALVEQFGAAVDARSPGVPALIAQIRASEDLAKLDPADRLGLEEMLAGVESGELGPADPGAADVDTPAGRSAPDYGVDPNVIRPPSTGDGPKE